MAADTTISASGGDLQVALSGGNLIRYRFKFFLEKPAGETFPETGSRIKKIHEVTLNKNHPPTDTFSLGPAAALEGLALTWAIDMKVPGGGGPLHFNAEVTIKQDEDEVMNWSKEGEITNTESAGDITEFEVEP